MIESKAQRDFNANSQQPINMEAYIQQRLANVTAMQVLDRLEKEFARREEFWRANKDDPHGISTILMVANADIKDGIATVRREITEACSKFTTNTEKPE